MSAPRVVPRTGTRLVDLTLPLVAGMRGVSYAPHHRMGDDGFASTDCALYSHCGTHVDAPAHMIDGGAPIDEIDLDRCVGPARVLDVPDARPGLRPDDLVGAEAVRPGDRVLLRTGWDRFARDDGYRTGFPHLSVELARWLAERGVVLVGVDTPSVGDLSDVAQLRAAHCALLERGVVVVESLANLAALPARVHLTVLPLPLVGVDGSPARVVADVSGGEDV